MRTWFYWRIQHTDQAVRVMRFYAACWWLSRQVEFLQWRLYLESAMASRELQPIVLPVREGEGRFGLLDGLRVRRVGLACEQLRRAAVWSASRRHS